MAKTAQQQEITGAPLDPVAAVEQTAFIADDTVQTIYGMTLGEIMQDATVNITRLTDEGTAKDTEIARLTAELNELKHKPKQFTDAEIAKAVGGTGPFGLKKLANGAFSLRVTVPEEVAIPLTSQADSAGEPVELFVQKTLEEALLVYTMS